MPDATAIHSAVTVGFALTRSARSYWVPDTALIALVVAGS